MTTQTTHGGDIDLLRGGLIKKSLNQVISLYFPEYDRF